MRRTLSILRERPNKIRNRTDLYTVIQLNQTSRQASHTEPLDVVEANAASERVVSDRAVGNGGASLRTRCPERGARGRETIKLNRREDSTPREYVRRKIHIRKAWARKAATSSPMRSYGPLVVNAAKPYSDSPEIRSGAVVFSTSVSAHMYRLLTFLITLSEPCVGQGYALSCLLVYASLASYLLHFALSSVTRQKVKGVVRLSMVRYVCG
ncbi:hypothetical protein MTO96_014558 [Rhipicephalus appendiculatus]